MAPSVAGLARPSLLMVLTVAAALHANGVRADPNAPCYDPTGNRAYGYFPCDPHAYISNCCAAGWTCYSNNLCVVADVAGDDGTARYPNLTRGAVARAMCTNPAWNNDDCGDFCLAGARDRDGAMVACGDNVFCCAADYEAGTCRCAAADRPDGADGFVVRSGRAQTVIGEPGPAPTGPVSYLLVPAAASSTASTASADPSSADPSSTPSSAPSSALSSALSSAPSSTPSSASSSASSSSTPSSSTPSSSAPSSSAPSSSAPSSASSSASSTAPSSAPLSSASAPPTNTALAAPTASPSPNPENLTGHRVAIGVGIGVGVICALAIVGVASWAYRRPRRRTDGDRPWGSSSDVPLDGINNGHGRYGGVGDGLLRGGAPLTPPPPPLPPTREVGPDLSAFAYHAGLGRGADLGMAPRSWHGGPVPAPPAPAGSRVGR